MGDQLTKVVTGAAALLPLTALAVAGVSGDDIDVALFVIGLIYLAWGFVWLAFSAVWRLMGRLVKPRRLAAHADDIGFGIFYLGFLIALAAVIVPASTRPEDFERWSNDFGYVHVWGILGIVVLALVLGIQLAPSSRPKTQKCPDCAETISADAAKCKHCGCRLDRASSPSAGAAADPPG